MKKAVLLLASSLAAAACGSIADPSHGEPTASLSGALSTGGDVPANARVALVWLDGASVVVGTDVAVVGGRFTMDLATPPDAYFSAIDGTSGFPANGGGGASSGGSGGGSTPPSGGAGTGTGTPIPPVPADAGTATPNSLRPLGTASGGVTGALMGAVAGFVAYVDANGNGKLDLDGPTASSPDTLIAGAGDLVLVYLRGGGALDLQRLADKSGKTPVVGYNLALTEGRWVGLDLVELTLSTSPVLPSAVCGGIGVAIPTKADGSGTAGSSPTADPGTANGYPSPTDPALQCSPDGRSYTYVSPPNPCPAPTPAPPPGLCGGGDVAVTCAGPIYGPAVTLAPDAPVPPGWPCPVPVDAGTPVPFVGH